MLYDTLYKRLSALTDKRIVLGDGDVASERAHFAGSSFELSYSDEGTDPLWASITLGL